MEHETLDQKLSKARENPRSQEFLFTEGEEVELDLTTFEKLLSNGDFDEFYLNTPSIKLGDYKHTIVREGAGYVTETNKQLDLLDYD